MADDIDIEEHDVLQNPVIRSIFPDISVIKKEISEYYEEAPGIKQEPETVAETTEKIPEKALVHIVDTTYFDNLSKEQGTLKSNKIILGSKPRKNIQLTKKEKVDTDCDRKNNRNNNIRIPKVVLQDLGTNIFQTNRYCKDCLTLFPCKSDYDNHNRHVHPVITRNKKLQIRVTLEKQNLKQTKHKCKICNSCFCSSSNLSRHYKNIHRNSFKIKTRQKDTSAQSLVTKSSKNLSVTTKPITRKKGTQKLTIDVNSIKNTNKCSISSQSRVNKSSKNLSVTTKPKTRKKVTHKITIDVNSIKNTNKCSICQSLFGSHYNLYRHYKNVHKNEVTITRNTNVTKTARLPKKISRVIVKRNKGTRSSNLVSPKSDANNTCFHCNKPFPDKKTLIEHIYEVLEPKRRSKGRLNNTILRNLNLKAEKNKTCQINPSTDKVTGACKPRKRLQDKLVFENEDRDASSDSDDTPIINKSNVLRNKNGKLLETNLQNGNVVNEYQDSDTNSFEFEDVHHEGTESIPERKGKSCSKIPAQQKKDHTKEKRDRCIHPLMMKNESKRKHGSQQSNPSKEENDLEYCKANSLCFDTTKQKIKKIKVHSNSAHEFLETRNNDVDNIVYECIYCTYMLKSARAYYMHVTSKHKVEKVPKINKIIFYEKCKYCPSKSINESAHNTHVFRFHYDLLFKNFSNEANIDNLKSVSLKNTAFKKLESFVLQSIIYKCNKCDIHFLSSYIAKDHEKHMELLINWKCSICKRIFKKHDKHLHLKQHQFSKSLNVCQFNESELSRLLYNCTKCAIHLTEDRYLEHYSKCGSVTTDSVYCKHCDILIDKYGYKRHDAYHTMGKNATDFTIIVADIIEVEKCKEIKTENKRKRLYEQVNCLTFCKTCKCYLTDVGLGRKSHIEARCSHIQKAICNICGLVLTHRAAVTHKEHHNKDSSLNLRSYKFFDLKGIQINPPVPEYPHCTNCDVYFVNKNAVKSHICSDVEYFSCNTCNIKLSENAYKFHVKFHEYAMPNIKQTSETDEIISLVDPMPKTEQKVESKDISSIQKDVDGDISENNSDNPSTNTIDNKQKTESVIANLKSKIMYSCQTCKIAVYSYDKVIEHCQNHFSPMPTATTTLKICAKCSLKYESDDYEKHQQYHSQYVIYDVNKILSFDPTYFASDDDAWIEHIFASVPLSIQKKVLSESIYRYERRIKMKIIQKGPPHLTVYRCDKCGFFIDPECLFAHSAHKCTKNIRKFPCSLCGLLFMSCSFRAEHEKIHRRYNSVNLKSYNIVLINCEEHKVYNINILNVEKQSVLYQCKACNGVVDKLKRHIHQCNVDDLQKCTICKLLFSSADFDKHVFLHGKKNKPSKKIILFDILKLSNKTKQAEISICNTNNADTNTIKSDVNIKGVTTSEDIEVLDSTTNKIVEYDKVNSPLQNNTIIVPSINKNAKYNKGEDILMITENNINEIHEGLNILENKNLASFDRNSENSISEIKKAIKLDKSVGSCNAYNNGTEGLNSEDKTKVSDSNLTEHYENGSVKETEINKIPSCNETEGENDDYVELAENKKMVECCSNVSKSENNKEESVDTTSEINEKYNVDIDTAKEKSANILTATNPIEIEMKSNDDKDKIISNQQAATLYKCKCGLHYADELNAKNCCPAKNKVIRQTCSKCSLEFNPKELFTHLIAFHKDKTKKYKYDVIEIDSEKL